MHIEDTLSKHLMKMTPPIDDDEELQESLEIEAKSRRELEAEGCPPCYPPDMDISKEIPPECRQIVEYWKSFVATDGMVLRAQLQDWRKFRQFQAQNRQYFAKRFGEFTTETRACLSSHGQHEQFALRLDPKDQGTRDTWIEFQHFQFLRLEKMEKRRDALIDKLGGPRAQSSPTASGHETTSSQAAHFNLEATENEIELHAILRQWIAERLPTMDPDLNQRDQPVVPRTRRPLARVQRLKERPIVGEGRKLPSTPNQTAPKKPASKKATPKKPAKATRRQATSARVQRRNGQPAEDKNNTILRISNQTANTTRKRKASHPDTKIDVDPSRPAKRRAAKEASPRPASSQQTKAQSNANQSNPKPSSRGAVSNTRRSIVTTRVGRISRPPARYTP